MSQVDFRAQAVVWLRLSAGDDRSTSGSSLTFGSRFSGSTLRISDDGSASSIEDVPLHPARPLIKHPEVSGWIATNEPILSRRVADTGSYFITTSRSRYGIVDVHQHSELLGSYDPHAPLSSAATSEDFAPRKERKRRLKHIAAKGGNGNVSSTRSNMDQPAPIKTSTSIFGQSESTFEPTVLRGHGIIQLVLEPDSQTSSVHLPSDKPTGHNSHIEPPKDERGKQENQIPQDVESNVSPFKLPQEIHSGQLSKRQLAKVQNIKMPMIAEENSRPSFPDIDSG